MILTWALKFFPLLIKPLVLFFVRPIRVRVSVSFFYSYTFPTQPETKQNIRPNSNTCPYEHMQIDANTSFFLGMSVEGTLITICAVPKNKKKDPWKPRPNAYPLNFTILDVLGRRNLEP